MPPHSQPCMDAEGNNAHSRVPQGWCYLYNAAGWARLALEQGEEGEACLHVREHRRVRLCTQRSAFEM